VKRPRITRRRFAAASVAVLTAFAGALWLVGGALLKPANRSVGPPPDDLPIESTTFASESGSEIATWRLPADGSRATILLLHPIRGNRRSMLSRARLFYNAGYEVVLVDLQAHGASLGEAITIGHLERYDVRAAVDFVRSISPNRKIAVVGRSLGGAAALLASPLQIDALVLESVYPTVEEAVHDRVEMRVGPLAHLLAPALLCQLPLRLGISADDLRPIEHIANFDCPILITSGDLDQHTTLAETQQMFDAAQEPKQSVVFQGAAHVDLVEFDAKTYKREVLSFLADALDLE